MPAANCSTWTSPKVMGILNITPDSFYRGSRYDTDEQILGAAEKMLQMRELIFLMLAVIHHVRVRRTSLPKRKAEGCLKL